MNSEKAFADWFAGSKVVDNSGQPLLVYHGTRAPGFSAFDILKSGDANGAIWGPGAYFDADAEAALYWGNRRGLYKDAKVVSVYLSIKNPVVFDDLPYSNFSAQDVDSWQKEGKDGIIYRYAGNIRQAVAWDPAQIKLK